MSSTHLTSIPQAVRVAASIDNSVDPDLKQQAIDYLTKVKHLSEETWQLYLQGAGAERPSSLGRDGKEKQETNMRIFCQQVVDTALTQKPNVLNAESMRAMYQAVVEFVGLEYIEGPCEGGQAFLRNKLAFTIAQLFLHAYPHIPSYLHPFYALLAPPTSSPPNFHPQLLTIRILLEVAQEIHDITLKEARVMTKERQERDGVIRDMIRSSGDDKVAVEGMLRLVDTGLERIHKGESIDKWGETVDSTLKALSAWIPWIDLGVSLNPTTLSFYHRILRQPIFSFRTSAASIYRTLVAKGIQDPQGRLQVLRVLDPVSLIDSLESETANNQDEDVIAFRASLGAVLSAYGVSLVALFDNNEYPEQLRNEAESLMGDALPLLLRFLSDRQYEIPLSVSPFVSDLLRIYKRMFRPAAPATKPGQPPSPPLPVPELSPERRQFLAAMLDILIRQLAWPEDMEWEAPGNEDDTDEEVAAFKHFRGSCRSFIESIAQIDKSLHTEVVARIVASTLDAYTTGGAGVVAWQQAELALHLVYTFGEVSKNATRAAFFDLPPEVATKAARNKFRIKADSQASGRTTPSSASDAADPSDKFEYENYPLSALGQLLTRSMGSGISSYPHPSVTLQYFEIIVRYVEFWKPKADVLPSLFEAILDARGVHNSDEGVRRRCFYLFSKLCRECRNDTIEPMVAPILDNIRDLMVITAELPPIDGPEDDPLLKATTGKTYVADQLYLFEASGNLIFATKTDPAKQMSLLQAVAGPLITGLASAVERAQAEPTDLQAVLQVHHHLVALGHFAKGFPIVPDNQVESLPYSVPFMQMAEALLQAIEKLKGRRVVRDAARFAFSQFANAIGTPVAKLVPRFVSAVVTEFEPSELVDFLLFLQLLMHRLQGSSFETMDMLLLPLLSRIFAVLGQPVTGTDEAQVHTRLKDAYLSFFTTLMNENLDGIFITDSNKPEFESVLTALYNLVQDYADGTAQRLALGFFSRSVIAWGTSAEAAAKPSVFAETAQPTQSKMVSNGTAQPSTHAISLEQRAKQCLPGYENFIYQRLLPACFEVPANSEFNIRGGQLIVHEAAVLVRNTVQARGQEAVDFILNDLLPRLQCPPEIARQLVTSLTTQQAKDFKKTFFEFIKAMRG
ncbi:exportin-T [Cryptococcus wingfieldii CBS 7118]|uniref:Exportin-T n=1 Tax=Cryptococcus wingfieldii CBS 7118 TaxID=1295528 RepID=A0A1E3JJ14_9TREE|nr:exportin-T [Cryptococcus wingfieldii CBS 7118]ODO00845.1 exportin-T [Cryptococcus wingfieldii CBS 7118]